MKKIRKTYLKIFDILDQNYISQLLYPLPFLIFSQTILQLDCKRHQPKNQIEVNIVVKITPLTNPIEVVNK